MLIFAFPSYKKMAEKLIEGSNINWGDFKLARFPNMELYITLGVNVSNQECLVLGTIAPPDENLISMLLLCHTLKKEGAAKVSLILPYIAYSRQDKHKPNESMATSLVGTILSYAGVDKIITVDVHSEHVAKLFPVPIESITPVSLIAENIKQLNLPSVTLVAPDENANLRNQELVRLLGGDISWAYLEKERTLEGVSHQGVFGDIKENVVIIDDILDTGETLVSTSEILKSKGVKNIHIIVTHGLFTGSKWRKLFELGVKEIFVTDSVNLPTMKKEESEKIEIISVIPLLRKALNIE